MPCHAAIFQIIVSVKLNFSKYKNQALLAWFIVYTFRAKLAMPMKHFLPFFFFLLVSVALQAQKATKVDLTIYPNPTTEYISVNDNSDVVGYIAVFNLVGKKVKEFDFVKGEALLVADLPKSMYLVQIQDRKRQVLKTQKMDKR